MIPEIRVSDANGFHVLRYLRLPDNGILRYFGGNANSAVTLDHGPHVWKSAESMMDLFARLANIPDLARPYQVDSSDYGGPVTLTPEGVRADELAKVLGIPAEDVVKHYGLLVKLADQPL